MRVIIAVQSTIGCVIFARALEIPVFYENMNIRVPVNNRQGEPETRQFTVKEICFFTDRNEYVLFCNEEQDNMYGTKEESKPDEYWEEGLRRFRETFPKVSGWIQVDDEYANDRPQEDIWDIYDQAARKKIMEAV